MHTTRQWTFRGLSPPLSVTSSLKTSILPVQAFMLSSSISMDSSFIQYVCTIRSYGIAPGCEVVLNICAMVTDTNSTDSHCSEKY